MTSVMMVVDQSNLASLHSALRKTLATMQQQEVAGLSRQGWRFAACQLEAAPLLLSPIQTSPPPAGADSPVRLLCSPQPRWRTLRVGRRTGAGGRWNTCWCRWRRGAGRWRARCRCSPQDGSPSLTRESAASRPVQIARYFEPFFFILPHKLGRSGKVSENCRLKLTL